MPFGNQSWQTVVDEARHAETVLAAFTRVAEEGLHVLAHRLVQHRPLAETRERAGSANGERHPARPHVNARAVNHNERDRIRARVQTFRVAAEPAAAFTLLDRGELLVHASAA